METEKALTLEAITAYQSKSWELLELIAAKFDVDLTAEYPFGGIRKRADFTFTGQLNEEWSFRFHGSECDFESSRTGQYLFVKIYGPGQFRAIDLHYLFRFIHDTPSLQHVSDVIKSKQQLYSLLAALETDGVLFNVLPPHPSFKILVVKQPGDEALKFY
jgi:hypothetical protein